MPLTCSNPLPAWRPGATGALLGYGGHREVPILSQPGGRELPDVFGLGTTVIAVPILSQPGGRELPHVTTYLTYLGAFQFSPSLEAGSYSKAGSGMKRYLLFQSFPSLEAGSYIQRRF